MMILKYSLFSLCFLVAGYSCKADHKEKRTPLETDPVQSGDNDNLPAKPQRSAIALHMDSLGLINIAELDSGIAVKLMYTRADNFTGEILYDNLTEAYLHPNAALALAKAQAALKRLRPAYRLIVYDAARPMSIQRKMWNKVKGTPKYIYVSNPARGGGLHNYGLAVDISILDSLGAPLPMGTPVDHLGPEAHITQEGLLVANGIISEAERQNRALLRKVMKAAGFRPLPSEWWHFNLCGRDEARRKYKPIP